MGVWMGGGELKPHMGKIPDIGLEKDMLMQQKRKIC